MTRKRRVKPPAICACVHPLQPCWGPLELVTWATDTALGTHVGGVLACSGHKQVVIHGDPLRYEKMWN